MSQQPLNSKLDIKRYADLTRYWATQKPDHPCTVFQDRVTTMAEFDAYASQVANGILGAGLKPQTRVGFLGKNSDLYFQVLSGAAKANTVVVGINWRLAPPEVEYIVNDASAEILFVEEEFFGLIDQIAANMPTLKLCVAMTGSKDGWESFLPWRDAQSSDDPNVPIDLDDVCVQLYTSGTTGHPKGVELSNRAFFALRVPEMEIGGWADWHDDDVIMVPMPVFHVGGTGWASQGFYHGATVVILEQADPGDIIKTVQDYRVTKVFVVPAVMQFMLQMDAIKEADFSHVRVVFYGASPIPEDVLVKAIDTFNCPFVQLYGMTEASGSVTYLPPEAHVPGTEPLKSCGIALPGVEIIIGDANDQPVAPREVGEILVKSPSMMKGYWNRPDATEEAMRNGWYHSGDAGYMDEEGYIYVYDRVKDMIVSGGENIYPAEIESALSRHEAIADIAVIGVPSEKWGEEVKAVIVKEGGKNLTEEDVIAFARTQIAGFKCPKSVDFVDALPRNPSGKLLKKELREPYWEGHERRVG